MISPSARQHPSHAISTDGFAKMPRSLSEVRESRSDSDPLDGKIGSEVFD